MKNRAGFTLIELLVVITIISLFIGWSTTNYFRQQERQSLQNALATVRSHIDNIRLGSTSLLLPEGVSLSGFQGYGFILNSSADTLTRFYLEEGTSNNLNILEISKFRNIELVSPTNASVYFSHSSGELLDLFGQTAGITIILKNVVLEQCASLSINELGIITSNDQVTCP
ncbi:hypothetical protein A2313_03660 [Candidatus Roizmanbacteria bacterium RIFOXYB2_FULL_41_10]|uniref:General secretion pathway GspH domain-containing protein n=1 Tax=Candidatus Roizmanbacteria bacterium RIFOXYA1_FULL_41_12 TaxID=1802082 RepID=A0A1F7KEL9_9BACT|nr:MAG: hypothetical protein A2209_02010 [Candidatus Roizmanbacteria bacterium RIFOXYA1_FULL_41_12]OGK67112.1 MAG: hypothetical protein A2377_00395 [Candidatus Roizmanbacteria bacterium RIFOXYB1_FULL_41_27]OGK69027.1 MAG: hypothetical protein A2313_03660 [Candidatus Roizmanbacteria bacterium RIFOXYB2_FULL_41_10]OGK71516.1 MAG: hypothetical protein A2403_00735 [Candidatus Roizmanbacteria bacterium RIFOXYC1_FULL_41_16]OGK72557.1 MAG: hypothetical protein A2459_02735 [Candidatus Roizmanbacteria ba